jgi:hypothetical protein
VKLVVGIVRPEKANDVLEALYRPRFAASRSAACRATEVSWSGPPCFERRRIATR